MIVVYGATGHTGTLIAQTLRDHHLEFAIAGRDRHRIDELGARLGCDERRVAQVHEPAELAEAFHDADVVINCAGPFASIGEAVIRAALEADCHYIDTTGEQAFVRDVYERFDSACRKAQRVVCNACAFEVALGDWAASCAAQAFEEGELDSVHVGYAVSHMSPSRGTQLSILESLGKGGCRWEEDRWVYSAPAGETLDMDFPEPFGRRVALAFPSAEVITIPRHVHTRRVQTYLSIGEENPLTRAASTIAPLVAPVLAPVMTPVLGGFLRSSFGAAARNTLESAERSAPAGGESFCVMAEARSGTSLSRVSVTGSGIYEITASVACLAAERLENEEALSGILAPSQLLDPADALDEIAELHQLSIHKDTAEGL